MMTDIAYCGNSKDCPREYECFRALKPTVEDLHTYSDFYDGKPCEFFMRRQRPDIGMLIRKKRKESKISQSLLAEALGVSVNIIKSYENGNWASMPVSRLADIAKALGYNLVIEFEE